MAEFCKGCAIDLGFTPRQGIRFDFIDLWTEEEWDRMLDGYGLLVLCEGCGPVVVDRTGKCISDDCVLRPMHQRQLADYDRERVFMKLDATHLGRRVVHTDRHGVERLGTVRAIVDGTDMIDVDFDPPHPRAGCPRNHVPSDTLVLVPVEPNSADTTAVD